MKLKYLFQKFKEWLEVHYEKGLDHLNNPITDEEINKLHKGLGFEVSEDLIQLLKIHNGQNENSGWLFEGQEFLSSHRILEEWNVWKNIIHNGEVKENISNNVDSTIKNNWCNPMWVPFTYDGSNNHYCIDMNPTKLGKQGQIITMWHNYSERELLNNNLYLWFKSYVEKLSAGHYIYSEDYGAIVEKEDSSY